MMKRRRIVKAVWGLVAAVAAVASSAAPAVSTPKGVELVGRLDVKLPEGAGSDGPLNLDLIFDSARRRAYQIISFDNNRTQIRQWDLDKRKVSLERDIPRAIMPTGPESSGTSATVWPHAYDPDAGILYLPYLDSLATSFAGIVGIDGKTLNVVHNYPRQPVNMNLNDIGSTSAANLPQQPTADALLKGMSFVPSILSGGQAKLLLFMQEPKAPGMEKNFNIPYVVQWDVGSGLQDFIYRVQACSNHTLPALGLYPVGIFQARLGAGIYVGCQATGGTGQVVRIDLDLNGKPTAEAAFPGPLGVFDIIPDEEADRMLLRVSNTEGQSWWVFDGTARSYTGVAGVTIGPAKTAAGVDPATGRLYVLAPPTATGEQTKRGGFMYTDVRRAPLPQMLGDDRFAQPGDGAISVDTNPTTGERLVYARKAESSVYLIFRDNEPSTNDETLDSQDRLTTDVPEKAGVTGRSYNGTGHAYGARALLVGGLNGAVPTGPDTNDIRVGRAATIVLGSPCGPGNREFVLGTVRNAALSDNLSSASASVGETDSGTKQDLNEPTGRCYPRPQNVGGSDLWDSTIDTLPPGVKPQNEDDRKYPRPFDTELDDKPTGNGDDRSDTDELAGSRWPFLPAECAGEGAQTSQATVQPLDRGDAKTGPFSDEQRKTTIEVEGFSAGVSCKQAAAKLDAYAQMLLKEEKAPALEAPIPGIGTLRVGEVTSRVSIYRDPLRGLVTRSEATAREISIGDHVYIDVAYAVGEAWAAGRPGTAATSFTRRLCGVRIKDEAPDQHVYRPDAHPDQSNPANSTVDPTGPEVRKSADVQPCGDLGQQATQNANLDPEKPVIEAINRVLGSRGRISAPKPDGPLSQGSPGGYIASIQKDRLEAISSQAVNNDASTQVPALELLVYNDDPTKGRGRQVYQLAGVDASVTYGIYLLNPGGDITEPCFCPPPADGGLLLPPPPPGETPSVDNSGPPPAAGPLTMLFSALGLLFRSPKDALLAAAVWALLFTPVQLSSRRRALRALS